MEKMKFNKQLKEIKGITLIALVITIVVLLILANVTISTLTQESGITNEAQVAALETRGSEVQEQDDLWDVKQYDYQYASGEKPETLEELLTRLVDEKLLTEEEKAIVEKTGRVTIGSRTIIFKEMKLPAVSLDNDETYLDDIEVKADPDGDGTKTPVKLDKGWKYFCTEGDRQLLIYEDYFPISALTIKGDTIKVTDEKVCAYSNREDFLNYLKGEGEYTDVWDEIKIGINNALKSMGIETDDIIVTGIPNLSQFEKAYNDRYWKNDPNNEKLTSRGSESTGYEYRLAIDNPNAQPWEITYPFEINVADKEVYSNKLFFPSQSNGYWIADPHANNDGAMICIDASGKISNSFFSNTLYEIRPIISFPESIFETE